ncbi:T-complex protein 11-like protein, partial [Camelus dromedarius]
RALPARPQTPLGRWRTSFLAAHNAPSLPSPDFISKMPGVEEDVPLKEPGVAESRPCKPETSGPTQEDKSSPEDHPSCSLEGRVKETIHNAFWDHLKEQLLAAPPDFSCALELLKEIKEILLSLLLPRQNRLRSEIEEALDMDLLKKEAEHGTLNVPHLSKYILNMMTLLCAPVRDEAVQKLENITDPVRLLRGIFQVLGLMKMDMVNYTIQSLQPQLQEHSIQYERAKFQELLNKQPRTYMIRGQEWEVRL